MITDFLNVIGSPYSPVVTVLSDGTEVTSIDWGYIGCVAFMLVLLWGTLRIIGRLLCGSDRR